MSGWLRLLQAEGGLSIMDWKIKIFTGHSPVLEKLDQIGDDVLSVKRMLGNCYVWPLELLIRALMLQTMPQ